jgi:hypothetical protein
MLVQYRALALIAWLCLALGAASAKEPPSKPARSAHVLMTAPSALYSRRALRRARILLQLRLLQLREERLERVRQIIERRLPSDLRPKGDLRWDSETFPTPRP